MCLLFRRLKDKKGIISHKLKIIYRFSRKGIQMNVKVVRYCFLLLFLILLIINVTIGLKHGFWIVIGLAILQGIAYIFAEKADKNKS